MNESNAHDITGRYLYVTKNNSSFKGNVRKIGASGIRKLEDPGQLEYGEPLDKKLQRYSTCVPTPWKPAYAIVLDENYDEIVPDGEQRNGGMLPSPEEKAKGRFEGHLMSIATLEKKLFKAIEAVGEVRKQRIV